MGDVFMCHPRTAPGWLAAVIASSGCFEEPGVVGPAGTSSGTTSPDFGSTTSPTTSTTGDPATSSTTAATASPDSSGCAGMSTEVAGEFAPNDIYIVLDTTGSMIEHYTAIQGSLDALVAERLSPDAHFVLVAPAAGTTSSVCMPTPIGSDTDCDSHNPPIFGRALVDTSQPTANPIEWLTAGLSAALPSPVLRQEATKTIVLISDSAEPTNIGTVDAVLQRAEPPLFDARIHTVTGSDAPCSVVEPTPGFEAIADHFLGQSHTLCPLSLQDWTAITNLRPSCRFEVPDSVTIDGALVVSLSAAPQLEVLEIIADPGMCTAGPQAYFNAIGTQLTLCRETCIEYQDGNPRELGSVLFEAECGA